MKVIGIIPTDKIGACEAYRISYPLRKLEMLGHKVLVVTATDLSEMIKGGKNPFAAADIAVFQRLTGESTQWNPFLVAARYIGCSVVVDYDDDYTNEHRKVSDNKIPDLSDFSAITVSTPYLRKVMLKYHRDVTIIPNYVVPEMMNRGFKRLIGGLTIGLTGSVTHIDDWKAVYRPLFRICDEFPDVKLFMSGYVPVALRDIPNVVTMMDLVPGADRDDFFIPLADYGIIMRNIDILLCPVSPNDLFNWSKSNLKAIEAQASHRFVNGMDGGCSVIASGDVPNYRDCIQDGRTGTLVNHFDEEGWYQAIRRNIIDVKWRESIQIAGHESCLKNWTIHTGISGRVAAYTEIIERDRKLKSKLGARLADLAAESPTEEIGGLK